MLRPPREPFFRIDEPLSCALGMLQQFNSECSKLHGKVDELGRALLPIQIRNAAVGVDMHVDCWIDTGFTGELVLSRLQIDHLKLPLSTTVDGILADGSIIRVDTYAAQIKWVGRWKQIEVIAAD
jgi:predicted aspartyl protease